MKRRTLKKREARAAQDRRKAYTRLRGRHDWYSAMNRMWNAFEEERAYVMVESGCVWKESLRAMRQDLYPDRMAEFGKAIGGGDGKAD